MSDSPARILVADTLHKNGLAILRAAGIEVDERPGIKEDEFCRIVGSYDGLIVRSAANVTAKVIEAGTKLKLVGRAGVGVDNIDVAAATKAGIIVQNTPTGNITSAAEHALALLFCCARNVSRADRLMKSGVWDKKGCTGVELSGRTLGIIGMGKVGTIVAKVARSLGMEVLVHDPYLNPRRATELGVIGAALDELLTRSDFISIHAPLTEQTRNLIRLENLKKMKPTARLINAARGEIVNEADLCQALSEKMIAGAGLDVFAKEPLPPDSPLLKLDNAVLTPHLGASTEEAQVRVAEEIAAQFVDFFCHNVVRNAVNLTVTLEPRLAPYANLADVLGQIAAQMTPGAVHTVEIGCYGKLAGEDTRQISLAALKGVLRQITDDPVTWVNAQAVAEARGIRLDEKKSEQTPSYTSLVSVTVNTGTDSHTVAGACLEGKAARIVRVDDFEVDLRPAEQLLIMFYPDRPGMVGKFGTILGGANINIANMAVGRTEKRGKAVVILTIDDQITDEVRQTIRHVAGVEQLYAITLQL